MGSLIGTLGRAPRQGQVSGLPLILCQEEIDLLYNLNKISLVKFNNPQEFSEEYVNKFQLYKEMNYQDQINLFKEERKKEIMVMADKIYEGKMKKKSGKKCQKLDKETILQGEMDKIGNLPKHQSLLQTFQAQPWIQNETESQILVQDWTYLGTEVKNRTFQDLWHKNFFITDGTKFGGDFLAYPGDPLKFHAKYVVICCNENPESIDEKDLVARSRLGTNVKKTVLLAHIVKDKVKYKAIKWTERLNKS